MEVREIKHRLNGSLETFYCKLLYRDDERMVISFLATADPYLAVAWVSEGYFWKGRNYLMYKMFNHYNGLVGHRFDVCKDVRFGPDTIDWTDLILDFFVDATGALHVHDEEELAEAIENGRLGVSDGAIVTHVRDLIANDYQAIIDETEALRDKIGLPPYDRS